MSKPKPLGPRSDDGFGRTERPPIWSEGRQNPPFELGAFARASHIYGREALTGLLRRCAASAHDAGEMVASGRWRVPPERLGRSGRFLPHHQSVAGAIAGAGRLLSLTSQVLCPAEAEEPMPSSIFQPAPPKPRPAPVLTLVAQQETRPEPAAEAPAESGAAPIRPHPADPALAAIRVVMGGKAEAEAPPAQVPALGPVRRRPSRLQLRDSGPAVPATAPDPIATAPLAAPAPAEPVPAEPALAARPAGSLRRLGAKTTARGLAYGLLAMSLPWGAVRAVIAHLDGVDLRKLDS
jgi:hypothetical protein